MRVPSTGPSVGAAATCAGSGEGREVTAWNVPRPSPCAPGLQSYRLTDMAHGDRHGRCAEALQVCTRVSSSYLNWTGRRGSLCGECEPPPRQGSSARTAHSRTAGAREPVKLWGREGAGASRAAPTALALPWNPSKTSPRKSLCGARQRRRKIHSPDEAMKRCISWCVSPPLECPLLSSELLWGDYDNISAYWQCAARGTQTR